MIQEFSIYLIIVYSLFCVLELLGVFLMCIGYVFLGMSFCTKDCKFLMMYVRFIVDGGLVIL